VPVDVRVVDSKGDPVTDLKKEDFTVTEDGIPQQVRLFDSHALTPEAPRPGSPPPLRKALPADAPAGTQALAQNQRIFLIVFGRGRLQWPDKGIDAAIKMVRERLLPQDRVAVLAYNRATDRAPHTPGRCRRARRPTRRRSRPTPAAQPTPSSAATSSPDAIRRRSTRSIAPPRMPLT
jgi:VWFA-related protein